VTAAETRAVIKPPAVAATSFNQPALVYSLSAYAACRYNKSVTQPVVCTRDTKISSNKFYCKSKSHYLVHNISAAAIEQFLRARANSS